MLISYNWLKQYIDLPDSITPEDIAVRLKAATVEVEKIHRQGQNLAGVVVGKVLSADKHPNADKLKVCKVDLGSEQVQIVCGGSNVSAGILAAVAKLGAKVKWHGEGELVEMKEAEIRGVKSYGMICASTEIGLGEMFPLRDDHAILDLTEILKNNSVLPGKPLAQVLGLEDSVMEVDNKSLSNRPDLWGHYGIAREVATLFKKELKPYVAAEIKVGDEIKLKATIKDKELCPRYMAVAVSGVKVAPSPAWLQQRIVAAGLRPINNIVDITNYVMYDLGEPMHAFDAGLLKNNHIVVRRANDGEKFKTLDGAEHDLSADMLVIADDAKAVALAGVMGGVNSGINDATTTVIFEAANFNADSIRKTSVRLGLRTDSSARFEKALDPNLCEQALHKAVELTLQVCPEATVASKVVDEKHFKLYQGPIELTWEFLEKKIGVKIDAKEAMGILTRLGFEVKEKKKSLMVKVPTWRATKDISIPEDLVEEVVRIYGYENIPALLPSFPISPAPVNPARALEHAVRDILVTGLGYSEVSNYSFVSQKQILDLGDVLDGYLELDNPLSQDKPFLRRSLLPNLLENVSRAIAAGNEVKIFEIGKVFRANEAGARVRANSDELLPSQDVWFTAIYAAKKDKVPFWQARQVLEILMNGLGYDWEVSDSARQISNWEHPTRTLIMSVGGENCGSVCEVHPLVCEKYGVDYRVATVNIRLSTLSTLDKRKVVHQASVAHPSVERDIAFVVKKEVAHAEVLSTLANIDHLLTKVELFDVYEGATIGDEFKSMAYRLTYSHRERTLKSEEVDAAQVKVLKALEKIGAEVRK